jgi:hypothetical protein
MFGSRGGVRFTQGTTALPPAVCAAATAAIIHALSLAYGIPKEKTTPIVGGAPIIHPYGWVGPLERVPFGGNVHGRLDYRELSKQIKTYTEQVEEESTVLSMQEAIRDADCIVFLGFAYRKQNMKLLFEPPPMRTKTKPIFGTALHMSDADVQEVREELLNLFPEIDEDEDEPDDGGFLDLAMPRPRLPSNDHMHIENKPDCSKLFDHYAKSLAG